MTVTEHKLIRVLIIYSIGDPGYSRQKHINRLIRFIELDKKSANHFSDKQRYHHLNYQYDASLNTPLIQKHGKVINTINKFEPDYIINTGKAFPLPYKGPYAFVKAYAYFIQRVKLVNPDYILLRHFPNIGGIYKFAAGYAKRENITVCQTTQFDIFLVNKNYPNFKPNFIYEAK